jgi:outer membrane receptor protein involved in Fe transport
VGTWIEQFEVNNGISPVYDCVGYYGPTCSNLTGTPSAPTPEWRHNARVTWTMPNGFGMTAQWRYFGPVKVDFSSDNPTLAGPHFDFSSKLGQRNYLDLAAWYTVDDKYTFRVGINNVTDVEPPLVTSGKSDGTSSACPTGPCNGNTYPAAYDALGRYIFANISFDF